MIFNSLEFLIFLPIVFLLYWVVPHRFRWIVLLIASYFFYMYWNWRLVFLIVFTTLVSYLCGILLEKYNANKKAKKLIVAFTLVSCIGVLIFFKYFNFLYEIFCDISEALSGKAPQGYFVILLPVGISFYTFQTASYVIDVYRGDFKAEKHLGYYALFVSFFPQLVAGPIERPGDLLPQLKSEKHLNDIDYSGAFRTMLVGFFKKIAVADVIGIFVNSVYGDISKANGLMVLIATVLFSFQIYCDFSGYSDIAVGCAKLFGANLTENFDSPYKSKSIKEFWNRWHLTLSRWLRDYIYFPLGGSRVPKWRWVLNILIVFFVSGLWHGANYTFIIWGLLHAVFQIIGKFTLGIRNKFWTKLHVSPDGRAVAVLRTVGTFALVSFSWIFFRADSLSDAFTAIAKLFGDYSFSGGYLKYTVSGLGLTVPTAIYVALSVPFMLALEPLKKLDIASMRSRSYAAVYRCSAVRYVIYVLLAFVTVCAWIYLQASDIGSSFIYFQF